jgi:hypothetical protein
MRVSDNYRYYTKRDAIAAALTSILEANVSASNRMVKDGFGVERHRVQTGPWMFGCFADVTGLSKATEKRIVKTMVDLMPDLRIKTHRKTIYQPRTVVFSF